MDAYTHGFIDKCAALGVDAEALAKYAQVAYGDVREMNNAGWSYDPSGTNKLQVGGVTLPASRIQKPVAKPVVKPVPKPAVTNTPSPIASAPAVASVPAAKPGLGAVGSMASQMSPEAIAAAKAKSEYANKIDAGIQ